MDSSYYIGNGRWNPSLYFDAKRREENEKFGYVPFRKSLFNGYGRLRNRTCSFHGNNAEIPCQISVTQRVPVDKYQKPMNISELFGMSEEKVAEQDAEKKYIKQLEDYLKMIILGKSNNEESSSYDKLLKLLSDARSILPCASISIGPWDKSKALTEDDIINSTLKSSPNSQNRNFAKGKSSRLYNSPSRMKRTSAKEHANFMEMDPIEGTSFSTKYNPYVSTTTKQEFASLMAPFTPTSVIRKVLLEKHKLRTKSCSSDKNEDKDLNTKDAENSSVMDGTLPSRLSGPLRMADKRTQAISSYYRPYDDFQYLQNQGSYLPQLQLAALTYMLRNPHHLQMLQNIPQSYSAQQFLLTPWSSIGYPVIQAYYSQLQQILRCANYYRLN